MDTYKRLRPRTDIEACQCPSVDGLLLVDLLTDNPLHCAGCRNQVDPDRLQLSVEETDLVARWFFAASALYRLWLHSGEYEQYAKVCLLDPNGEVNREGIMVARKLSERLPTRLWYFYDTDDGEPTTCPSCGEGLEKNVRWGIGKCPTCPIHL